jgi:ABC-type phosphate transport system ATPase subunit
MNDSGALSDPAINMADPFSTMDVGELFGSLVEEYTPEQHVCHNEHQAYGRYRVNLSMFEDLMLGEVVFTRELFQQVSQIRRSLISGNTNTI